MTASPDRGRPPPRSPAGDAVRQAYATLLARVEAVLSERPRRVGPMVRIEVPAPAVDPVTWLAAQGGGARIFWSERDHSRSVAGVGVADHLALGEPDRGPADLMARVAGRLEGAPPVSATSAASASTRGHHRSPAGMTSAGAG